ncbi:Uncharacterized protein C8034_v006444 [Colletotrichum sidae]|uniref:Uncharacterized protein n=1 Tax=Colletotrichum sidae TaxID=1347389 RepID=A0A4R8T4T4_9PEZI|nr:Uncharacterized protein C8034_v006444 [Colletotrichum sidae]
MASFVARRAFSTSVRRLADDRAKQQLTQESKRNPEIFILGGVMAAALGGAGLYFGRSPTTATSESPVLKAGMPWETESSGKYKYHPGGNPNAEPKDAPSAVNTVIVPNVTLPKVRQAAASPERRAEFATSPSLSDEHQARDSKPELHEKYNKWGKDGYP